MKVLSHLCLLALLCLFLALAVTTTFDLPEKVAIHFSLGGTPDRWASAVEFRGWMTGFILVMNLVVVASFTMIQFIPTRHINLPNRDYWFHPERRKQSMLILYENGLWTTIAFNLFNALLFMLVADANSLTPPKLDLYVAVVGTVFFIGGIVYISTRIYQSFNAIPEESDRTVL
ncbi:DUF1648 domain-containing protein [Kamptonema cortianum]|nr:DUF1648 domain-containing protein [Kamptonema cortianum]